MLSIRHCRSWVGIAGLLLLVGAAQSEGSSDRALDDYRNATRRALHACGVPFASGKRANTPSEDQAYRHCSEQAKLTISDKFEAVMASSMDPAARAALQRYQAAFLVSLSGLPPLTGEAPLGYEQRQAGLRCSLSHAWSEFDRSELPKEVRPASSRPGNPKLQSQAVR